jgi:cell division protein FtsA
MPSAKYENIVTGLDLGTSKVRVIIGEAGGEDGVNIVGLGEAQSHGLNKGVVVNIDSTVESIHTAVREAERMAGVEIGEVWVGVGGAHIQGDNSRGVVAVVRKDKVITGEDRDRAIESAQTMAIPGDREVLHVLPREFIVDGQDGVKDPEGITGVRLECEVHLVTGAVTSVQNVINSVKRAGLQVVDVVLQPLAASLSSLSADEKDLGVVLLYIGGGTSEILVFIGGAVEHSGVIALGGSQVTADVAVGLRTPNQQAESIKMSDGYALANQVTDEEEIIVPGMGGRSDKTLARRVLAEVIQQRLEEMLELVAQDLRKYGLEDRLPAGVVLTGGTARLGGIAELAEKVMELPVRIGSPAHVTGLSDMVSNSEYSTAVGLVMHGFQQHGGGKAGQLRAKSGMPDLWQRTVKWFKDNF